MKNYWMSAYKKCYNVYFEYLSLCKKTKAYREHDIPFEYIDYDLADRDKQVDILNEMCKNGANGFPFVKIEDEIVVGYKPEEYSRILGLNK